MDGHALIKLMEREMEVRAGPVATSLGGVPVGVGCHLLLGDEFLLREPELAVHYQRGRGVTVERGPRCDPGEEALFLGGSVYAAVASINGMMPIHASAVAVGGRVVAFTGPSGAGKSTATAGLARLGLPLFCDDTLVLFRGADGVVMCLPGHKRLKLWPDAADLTQSAPLEQVSAGYAKFYVTSAGGDVAEALPFSALIFLEAAGAGEEPRLEPVTGGDKIARLDDDHYTRALFDRASGHSPAQRFALLAHIAAKVRMARFVRDLNRDNFWTTTRYLADKLSDMAVL